MREKQRNAQTFPCAQQVSSAARRLLTVYGVRNTRRGAALRGRQARGALSLTSASRCSRGDQLIDRMCDYCGRRESCWHTRANRELSYENIPIAFGALLFRRASVSQSVRSAAGVSDSERERNEKPRESSAAQRDARREQQVLVFVESSCEQASGGARALRQTPQVLSRKSASRNYLEPAIRAAGCELMSV